MGEGVVLIEGSAPKELMNDGGIDERNEQWIEEMDLEFISPKEE